MARKSPAGRARPKSLDRVEPLKDDCVMVVIETPKGSPNKLAFESRYGTLVLKGVLPAGAVFPFDFGFVPSTRAEDGDPMRPVFPGCIVPSRLVGGRWKRRRSVSGVSMATSEPRPIRARS